MPFSQKTFVDKGKYILQVRLFYRKRDDPFFLACERGIVFSMDELYYNKLSEEFVETLEDVVAYKISLADLNRLFQTNIELANWGRIIHQNEYRRLQRSHKERLALPAKERYEEFKQQFPQVCQRANPGYIASYLGIKLSTLSRLRAQK